MASREEQRSSGEAAPEEAESGATDSENGMFSELKDTARDAALAVLKPAVKSAAQSAAGYAVNKGPDLVKDRVGPKLDEAGGIKGLADQALSNAGPAGKVASKLGMGGKLVDSVTGGDDEGDGEADLDATGSGRRMPVQQAMDVAVPLEVAYNQWTQFEEYPSFMQRVDSASQEDETHVRFTEKIWGFGRDFEAEIVEQRPYERIVWRSVNGLKHAGVVTFHQLSERLTRIEVTVDFKPESLFQKFARGARYSKRAIRADMHRFKAYIEMSEEEDGAWLGRIEDNEVVGYEDQREEGAEGEAQDAQTEPGEAEAEQPEEPEEQRAEEEGAEEEASGEEAEAEAEDEEEAVEEAEEAEPEEPHAEEEAEEEAPRRRRAPARRKRAQGNGQSRARKQRRRPSAQRGQGGSGRRRRSPERPRRPRTARS